MSLISAITESVRSTARFTRTGVDRVRLEAKRRGLERRRRQALEDLGTRVRALSLTGDLGEDRLTPELAEVAAAEMRIAACEAEIDDIGSATASSTPAPPPSSPAEASATAETGPDHDDDDDAARAVAEAEAATRSADTTPDAVSGPVAPDPPATG